MEHTHLTLFEYKQQLHMATSSLSLVMKGMRGWGTRDRGEKGEGSVGAVGITQARDPCL